MNLRRRALTICAHWGYARGGGLDGQGTNSKCGRLARKKNGAFSTLKPGAIERQKEAGLPNCYKALIRDWWKAEHFTFGKADGGKAEGLLER